MSSRAPLVDKAKERCIFSLCVGTALMDFTSHIASQATPAYAIQVSAPVLATHLSHKIHAGYSSLIGRHTFFVL